MNPNREQREWWAVADDGVYFVIGYSCAPQHPQLWWCPKVGYSLSEEKHLFKTEWEAIDKLVEELTEEIRLYQEKVEALKSRRKLHDTKPKPALEPD